MAQPTRPFTYTDPQTWVTPDITMNSATGTYTFSPDFHRKIADVMERYLYTRPTPKHPLQ